MRGPMKIVKNTILGLLILSSPVVLASSQNYCPPAEAFSHPGAGTQWKLDPRYTGWPMFDQSGSEDSDLTTLPSIAQSYVVISQISDTEAEVECVYATNYYKELPNFDLIGVRSIDVKNLPNYFHFSKVDNSYRCNFLAGNPQYCRW